MTKVRFLSPEYFAKTLHIGKKIAVMEGSNVHGYLTVKKILNKIMDETYD